MENSHNTQDNLIYSNEDVNDIIDNYNKLLNHTNEFYESKIGEFHILVDSVNIQDLERQLAERDALIKELNLLIRNGFIDKNIAFYIKLIIKKIIRKLYKIIRKLLKITGIIHLLKKTPFYKYLRDKGYFFKLGS